MSVIVHPASENPRLDAGLAAEARHQMDPAEDAFTALACAHPEACSCAEDYPGWTPGGAR